MEIAIIGPGGLGCLFAVFLAKAGHNVCVLDRNRERAAKLNAQGIIYTAGDIKESIDLIQVSADPAVVGVADLVLLCVKSQDVQASLQQISAYLASETLLLAFQNGIGHHGALAEVKFWGLAVTAMGASMGAPGQVRYGGKGQTFLGFVGDVTEKQQQKLKQVSTVFNEAGLATDVSADILATVWNKLIVNVGINALTALHNCPNGELLNRPQLLDIQEKAVLEADAVARAKGIAVAEDPVAMVRQVCRNTCGNISSMLQDIRRGRQTEIEAINGAVVKEAADLQVNVPVNITLCEAVKELERAQ